MRVLGRRKETTQVRKDEDGGWGHVVRVASALQTRVRMMIELQVSGS